MKVHVVLKYRHVDGNLCIKVTDITMETEWFEMKTVTFLGSNHQLLKVRVLGRKYLCKGAIELSKAERPACVLRFALESWNVGVSR